MAVNAFDKAFSEALAEAARWVGKVPGVQMVGQGELNGSPTVDVWVSGAVRPQLPQTVHGFTVRVFDSGGPVEAQ